MLALEAQTRNIIFLGVSFFCVSIALNTAAFVIEPSIESASNVTGINPHAGYHCMSIMYATYTVSNIVATPLVDILQPKWALCIAALGYTVFYGAIFWVDEVTLYMLAVVLGSSSALLWTGLGTYLAQNSNAKTVDRNSSVVLVFCQAGLIAGGLFIYVLFSNTEHDRLFSQDTARTMFSAFGSCSFVSSLLFAFIPTSREAQVKTKNYVQILVDMGKLVTTPNMLLLSVAFAYNGLQIGFWMIVYPTAISFTKSLVKEAKTVVALVSVFTGIGEVVAAIAFSLLGAHIQKIGRNSMLITGMILHVICFALIFLALPAEASLRSTFNTDTYLKPTMPLVVFIAFLLGVADIFWYQQLLAFVCDAYPQQETPAFALNRFLQAGMSGVVMFYSSRISLPYQMLIATVFSIAACATFAVVERNMKKDIGYNSYFFGDLRTNVIAPSEAAIVKDCESQPSCASMENLE